MKRALENAFLAALAAGALYFLRGDLLYFYRGQQTFEAKAAEVRAEDLSAYAHQKVRGRVAGEWALTLRGPLSSDGGEALLFPLEGTESELFVYTRDPALLAAEKTAEGAIGLLGERTFTGRAYPTREGKVRLPGCSLDLRDAYAKAQKREVGGSPYVLLDGAPRASVRDLLRPGLVAAAFAVLLAVRARTRKP